MCILLCSEDQKSVLKETEEKSRVAQEKIAELEDKMKNAKAYREKEMKNAEQQLKEAKTKLDASRKAAKEKEQVSVCVAVSSGVRACVRVCATMASGVCVLVFIEVVTYNNLLEIEFSSWQRLDHKCGRKCYFQ